jgi:serine peptidase DegS
MSTSLRSLKFIGQSVVAGLAIAFLVVLLRPELLQSPAPQNAPFASVAAAVPISAPAVATIYTGRMLEVPNAFPGKLISGRGLGSGVVLRADGYVVTNWHVIRDADEILVQLADGREAMAELVGADPDTELALLKIDLPDLPSIRLGRSDAIRIGDIVLAIGNSYGLGQTVTMGIVSATGRGQLGVTTFENFIQTDAAINVGNSGGALINASGELIGINTAVISASSDDATAPEGIGFAIPVNLVRGVMEQLISNGRVVRGWLGVDARDLTNTETETLGISGPAVQVVRVSGPALDAGLLPGDVVTHINDERMLTRVQAMNVVARQPPGTRIRIRGAHRDGRAFETAAVLAERTPPGGS